jgi:polysaccharide biosynthesis transport protein
VALDDLLRVIRRRWWLVVATIVVAAAIGFTLAAAAAPTYVASAQIIVVVVDTQDRTAGLAADDLVRFKIIDYASLADTEAFLQRVVETDRLPMTRHQLSRSLSISSPKIPNEKSRDERYRPPTPIITVTARSDSPVLAADVANSSADVLAQVLVKRESMIPIRAVVAEHAVVPKAPVAPELWRIVAQSAVLGLIFGVLAAVSLALVRDRRETEAVS